MTRRIEDPKTGAKVDISSRVQRRVKGMTVNQFADILMGFMAAVGADYAYVGKQASGLYVSLIWPPGSRTEERRRS